MRKIQICFITSHFPQGGAERQILELMKGLIERDYQITLICYQSDFIFFQELKSLDLTLILNKNKASKYSLIRWVNNIIFLRKYLKINSYDILHTYLFYNGFIVRLFAPNKYKNKIIYSIRNSYTSTLKFFYFLDKLLNKKSINIYNSKKSFSEIYPNPHPDILKNNIVIYNGFNEHRFFKSDTPNDQMIKIGMVGRITKQKNQLQVLRVLNKMKYNLVKPLKFYLIGDSFDERKNIDNFITNNNLEEKVVLLNAQNNIEDYYSIFDIFVLSSLYEGCPNVLFEALLSKCLCVVSNGSNSDLFIKDGINGFVYDGSDKMLELKFNEALDQRNIKSIENIVNNGYNYARDNFTISKMLNSYETIYKNIYVDDE
jgi:glycosyltransferase involved in cell wall biosynthesis